MMRWGRGVVATVKYVGRGIVILFVRRSVTASLSSENKLPVTMARAKLFFACKVDNLVNTG
jgi:hypothetical protein